MKLNTIYDVELFLSEKRTLSIADYKIINKPYLNPEAEKCLRAYIINYLPFKSIPEEYTEQAIIINKFLKSREFLNTIEEINSIHPIFGTPIKEQITLYDLIIKHDRFPAHKYLSTDQLNIQVELENFHKSWALDRFFINQGCVFYGDAIERIPKIHRFSPYNAHSLINFYPLLLQQNILRNANKNDVPILLGYKTKKQLLEVVAKLNCFDKELINKLRLSNKTLIISRIKDRKEIQEIQLQDYFYFLSEDFQRYKDWIALENVYYQVYNLFDNDIKFFKYSIASIMNDLIRINNDYETANRLGELFYSCLKDFKIIIDYDVEQVVSQVNYQMNKIRKVLEKKTKGQHHV